MKIKSIGTIQGGQDGAIFNGLLFRFDSGKCTVYDLEALENPIANFTLDRADTINPHSNAVCFGKEYFSPDDEFPLLYSNIYNNYADKKDNLCGVCCVYRLWREGDFFNTKLVQLIRIGFTDSTLWRSADIADVRPWGNFVVDAENGKYYGFVMRDGDKATRYFAFDLPSLSDGEEVVLTEEDIKEYFDTPYHNFLQGACFHDGKIYEVEGFGERIHPALRIIDPVKKEQIFHFDFYEAGAIYESELIDFYNGRCIYGDNKGNLFELVF